ncbi:MAG: hypothetical protein IPM39_13385 [Chloroflexi bacterium]|nr:hypothetical protein [Chloroflexota bacterium]
MSLTANPKGIDNSRLLVGSLITLIVAVVGNLIVGFLAKAIFPIPAGFLPLDTIRYTIFTIVGVLGGIIVYLILARTAKHPIRTFQRIAWAVLVLSMLPDIGMLTSDFMPGATPAGVITLMVMHLVAGLSAIYVLPRMTKLK